MGKRTIGFLALGLAVIAVGAAILPEHLLRAEFERRSLAGKLDIAKDKAVGKITGKAPWHSQRTFDVLAMVCAVLGLALGVASWTARGDKRLCLGAVALAGFALAWPFLAR